MVWRMVDVDVRKEIQRLLASEMPHGAISAMARHLEAASVFFLEDLACKAA